MRGLAVGVDAGGTSTTAIAARDGEVLDTQTRSAANASAIGVDAATATIADAVVSAAGAAPDAIVVGAAGAGEERAAAALRDALQARFPNARIEICDDGRIALRAGTTGGDGIVLIAGTGSYCYAEIGGTAYRAGGYGYLLGDEGSGYALGNAAMRALLRVLDGRAPHDAFTRALLAALESTSGREAAHRIYRSANPVTALAALAPLVLEHAAQGERSASKIAQAAASDLADLVKTIVLKANCADRELPIVFAGGLLRNNSLLTYLLETRLSNDYPRMSIVKGASAPHVGALALAQEML